ncbi:MAG: hypothetical protein QXO57_00410 [Candidatus Aenigmatarchaeota archaeon]|nr:hypothetical protein [Candidatus Aenigmarchaeota archaeon]
MGVLKVNLPDDLERKFREYAMKLFGYSRGSLSAATEQLVAEFVKRESTKEQIKKIAEKEIKNPVEAIKGLLSHVKGKTSVELQHEARRYRTRMAMQSVSRRKHISRSRIR